MKNLVTPSYSDQPLIGCRVMWMPEHLCMVRPWKRECLVINGSTDGTNDICFVRKVLHRGEGYGLVQQCHPLLSVTVIALCVQPSGS